MIISEEIKKLKTITNRIDFSEGLACEANRRLQDRLLLFSKPPGEIDNLRLVDVIDISLLQELQDSFSSTYNIASVIYDENGIPITRPSNFSKFCRLIRTSRLGLEKCEASKERHYEMTIELGGACLDECKNFIELLDGSVPFEIEGRRIGTWCAGQRVVEPLHEDIVRKYAEEIKVSPDELWEYAQLLSTGTREEYQKIIDFLNLMCQALSVLGLQNIQQAQEIYKRTKVENKLSESRAKYKTIFEFSQDAIFIMENDLFIDCNDAALKMFGCEKDDILNVKPSRFSPEFQPSGRNSEEGVQIRTSASIAGEPQRFPWRHIKYDGTPFDVEVNLNKIEISGTGYCMAVLRENKPILHW